MRLYKLNLNVRVEHEAGVNLCSVRCRQPAMPYKDRIYKFQVEQMSEQKKQSR